MLAALWLVLDGTSWAQDAATAAKKLVTGKQIVNGACVRSRQVQNA